MGNGTWRSVQPFDGVTDLRDFVWGDLDADGDPDAALVDGNGALHVRVNLQAGQFDTLTGPASADGIDALALGDLDADGRLVYQVGHVFTLQMHIVDKSHTRGLFLGDFFAIENNGPRCLNKFPVALVRTGS